MNLSPDRVRCTVMRHAWEPSGPPPDKRRAPWGVALHFTCTRCGTVRRDVVDSWAGNLIHRNYWYPDGYRVPADERPKLDDVRLAYLAQTGQRRRRKART